MNRNALATSIFSVAAGLAFAQPATAVTENRLVTQTGANMCTLSVPTTDTKIRPRSTGFNNEGTTNAFVICSFNSPPGDADASTQATNYLMYMKSMDGLTHSVDCTGVNSLKDGEAYGVPTPKFVTKTTVVNDSGSFGTFGVPVTFLPADFGGTTTIPSYGGVFSITCILPPQVSIKVGFSNSAEDVGN